MVYQDHSFWEKESAPWGPCLFGLTSVEELHLKEQKLNYRAHLGAQGIQMSGETVWVGVGSALIVTIIHIVQTGQFL